MDITKDMRRKDMQDKTEEVITVGAKLAGGFAIFGLTPAEYAGFATALYFFLQTAYLIWKWVKESKQR